MFKSLYVTFITLSGLDFLFNTAMSFVETQGRFLYKEIRDNPKYLKEFSQGKIPVELGKKAKKSVMNQLSKELQSDAFKSAAKNAMGAGIDIIIERTVTENKKETSQKTRALFKEIIPMAMDAAMLDYANKKDLVKDKNKIIKVTLKFVSEFFDYEQMLFSNAIATLLVKSELFRRISRN